MVFQAFHNWFKRFTSALNIKKCKIDFNMLLPGQDLLQKNFLDRVHSSGHGNVMNVVKIIPEK